MNTKLRNLIIAILAILGVGVGYQQFGSVLQTDYYCTGSSATTSPVYVATSTDPYTCIIPVSDMDEVGIDIMMTAASSSSVILRWHYEFSDNRIDWYPYDQTNQTSGDTITLDTSTTTYIWTPGVTTQVQKHIDIENINAKYLRLKFVRGLENGLGNYGLWIHTRTKSY